MKKHIIGLTLFSFIVSAAAIVYTTFDFSDIPNVSVPETDNAFICNFFPNFSEETARIGKINDNSPIIRQAVFDRKGKIVFVDLHKNKSNPEEYEEKLPLKFSFFIKNSKETKLVATEIFRLGSDFVEYNGKAFDRILPISCEWLDKLKFSDNLYVLVEVDSEYHSQKATSFFDERFAIPVTVLTDKTFVSKK